MSRPSIQENIFHKNQNRIFQAPCSNEHAKLAENQTIVGKAFAGKGTKAEIRKRYKLEAKYNIPADRWQKMSGNGYVIVGGKHVKAELHWYEADGTIVDMKVKYKNESDISLTNGKVYDVIAVENGMYRIVDDTEEDYLFYPEEFDVVQE